jgi:hypothetical protein
MNRRARHANRHAHRGREAMRRVHLITTAAFAIGLVLIACHADRRDRTSVARARLVDSAPIRVVPAIGRPTTPFSVRFRAPLTVAPRAAPSEWAYVYRVRRVTGLTCRKTGVFVIRDAADPVRRGHVVRTDFAPPRSGWCPGRITGSVSYSRPSPRACVDTGRCPTRVLGTFALSVQGRRAIPRRVAVPNVERMTPLGAECRLAERHLRWRYTGEVASHAEPARCEGPLDFGLVITDQHPGGGHIVPWGSVVTLTAAPGCPRGMQCEGNLSAEGR